MASVTSSSPLDSILNSLFIDKNQHKDGIAAIKKYVEDKKINELFNELLTNLLATDPKPDNVKDFLRE